MLCPGRPVAVPTSIRDYLTSRDAKTPRSGLTGSEAGDSGAYLVFDHTELAMCGHHEETAPAAP